MTPEQALSILDQVAGQISATRETHAQIQVAIDVLSNLIRQQPDLQNKEFDNQ